LIDFDRFYYIANVIVQICLLNVFLGTNFLKFGYESVKLLRFGLNQPESKYFPRETFCDFQVREPLRGGEPLQRITVQCVLTVNLFNQQIFTVLWIWFVALFILNLYSLVIWIGRLCFYRNRFRFIHSRLTRTSREEVPRFRFDFKHSTRELGDYVHEELVRSFIIDYLEPDGFFFIRMLTVNASDFVVQEVIELLWKAYTEKYGESNAIEAENAFYQFRNKNGRLGHVPRTTSRFSTIVDDLSRANDAKRKYMKQRSNMEGALLRSTSAPGDQEQSNNNDV